MELRLFKPWPWLAVLAGASWLALASAPAFAQQVAWGGGHGNCPPAPCPFPEIAPPPVVQPPTPPTPRPPEPGAAQPPVTDLALGERSAALGGETVALPMIGDQFSASSHFRGSSHYSPVVANARAFKVADNETVAPTDRIFVTFNYFNDVNRAVNIAANAPIGKIDAYIWTVGFEKTFFDGNASIGMRLPLNRLTGNRSVIGGPGGTFDDIGDLTIISKFALMRDRDTGSLLSGGVAFTAPTGPRGFAGAPEDVIAGVREPVIQPYLAYELISGNFYVHGFEEVAVPTSSADVTLLFTDVGVGYFLSRDRNGDRTITAIVPTVEMHLNDPLNHRGSRHVPLGVPDWLVLTEGVNIELNRRSLLTLGVAEPLTGPRVMTVEGIAELNFRF
jgi:hypothetical protein